MSLPSDPQYEHIPTSTLSSLVTNDVRTSHGVPGGHVTYHSQRFGKIDLRVPPHPDIEEGRKLFAHYLWHAAVIAAEGLERASSDAEIGERAPQGQSDGDEERKMTGNWPKRYWDVRGKKVLELGAGTALPSIIAVLSGSLSATITDHPSSPALTTGAIEQNVQRNVVERLKWPEAAGARASTSPLCSSTTLMPNRGSPAVDIFGYTWGMAKMYLPSHYGKSAERQPKDFDRIIIADCLWMPAQHVNLVKTILHYLCQEPSQPVSPAESCALVVAGFHTGREIVRHFFEVATGEFNLPPRPPSTELGEDHKDKLGKKDEDGDPDRQEVQGRLRAAEIFEIDANGLRRPWEPVRPKEDNDQAKRWCVVAVLERR
ncbi:uncharacterized protein PV07_06841 [Cladophialophora immunda]|uniref:Nicotinamide N-methyltransferase n=1 Tax=Cladophialophora immunda TaxID=569365 RepID=A0A0D2APQ3_9EURO|nr:uncharacterized protein PV07_06841 [Cladophialophora immunda]KIW27062.1 hypothetical protein PV07_06841 [Cladophialophora immunda]OQU99705.1 hypothetical protein CLAIMM_05300 [Cladophialophora immunda]